MIAFYEKGNIYCTNDNDIVPYKSVNLEVPDGTSPLDLIYDGKTLRIKNETEKEADRKELEKREALQALAQSDAGMARVAEDIIDVLIEKQVIKKEDFLESVIKKIDERKALREKLK